MGNSFQYKTNKVSKKCVYYEGTDTLYTGYTLCYNFDTTTNMNGTTIAAGSDCNGKYLRVEQPSTNNANYFAGIVAGESNGVKGPAWVTIIDTAGDPIIMIYSNDNITADDIIYLQNESYMVANSGGVGKPIARALESVNRSETNGLIACKMGDITAETVYSAEITALSDEVIVLSDAVAAYDGTILEANLSDQIIKEASDVKVFSDTIFSDEKVLSDRILSIETYLNASIQSVEKLCSDAAVVASNSVVSVELFLSNELSDRLASIETYLKTRIDSVENLASDAIVKCGSDEEVLSDRIFSIETYVNTAIQSVEVLCSNAAVVASNDAAKAVSDATVVQSHLTYRADSIETYLKTSIGSVELFLSNEISDRLYSIETYLKTRIDSVENLASDGLAKADSDEVVLSDSLVTVSNKVFSEHIAIAGAFKRCASDIEFVFAQDANYSDVATLASDLRTCLTVIFSDLCADISNELIS